MGASSSNTSMPTPAPGRRTTPAGRSATMATRAPISHCARGPRCARGSRCLPRRPAPSAPCATACPTAAGTNNRPPPGRDCGNGVVIDHDDGWQTQYCHLRRGSVGVTRGQAVARGDRLGVVGMSGRTQFPHLHLSVRRDGAVIDPFAPSDPPRCTDAAQTAPAPLWSDPPGLPPRRAGRRRFRHRHPRLRGGQGRHRARPRPLTRGAGAGGLGPCLRRAARRRVAADDRRPRRPGHRP